MKWLRRLGKRTLPIAWKYTAVGQIWRLIPAGSEKLVLELRDVERKEVLFAALDGISGTIAWTVSEFRSMWWVTIETIHDHVLFLHEYATPDMPEHKSIIAVDLRNGSRLWSQKEMKFLFAHERAVYAAKDSDDGRQFFELELSSGAVLREVDDGYLGVLRSTIKTPQENILFPSTYGNENGKNSEVESVIGQNISRRPGLSAIEYIGVPSAWIVGSYERLKPEDPASPMRHRLEIFAASDLTRSFSDELDANAKMAIPDLFFCRQEYLYYIKEKNTVCAVHLAQP